MVDPLVPNDTTLSKKIREQFIAQEAKKAKELASSVRSQGFGAVEMLPPPKILSANSGRFASTFSGFNTGFAFAFGNDIFDPNGLSDTRINNLPFIGEDRTLPQANAYEYVNGKLPYATNKLLFVEANVGAESPVFKKAWENGIYELNSIVGRPVNIEDFVFIYLYMPAAPGFAGRPGNYIEVKLGLPKFLADELLKLASNGNPIEDFFQALFPNITGEDRSAAIARYKADRLEIIDRRTPEESRRIIKLDPPIGEYLTTDPKAKEPIRG